MDVRHAVREIRRRGTDLQWWRKRFLTHVVSRYYEAFPPERSHLVDRDWDNVLLLDACRYDLFAEVSGSFDLPGDLSRRRSAESGTPGYLRENFAGGQFHDVVYVTANPYVNTVLPDDTFHDVVPVWRDGWDETEQTVLPEAVLDAALAADDIYPDKRLLVHFNQPHVPFVGEYRLGDRRWSAIRREALGKAERDPRERNPTPFEMLAAGEVAAEDVWRAYRSNLERVLPAVEELLAAFRGRTCVTSDHGNALGEYARPFPIRVYGHPLGILIPALVDVPWFVSETSPRKDVVAEPPRRDSSDEDVDEGTRERLRMLGYAE